eukprot:1452427-Amphidinium_carterae.1
MKNLFVKSTLEKKPAKAVEAKQIKKPVEKKPTKTAKCVTKKPVKKKPIMTAKCVGSRAYHKCLREGKSKGWDHETSKQFARLAAKRA